jgi:hypothetical protein
LGFASLRAARGESNDTSKLDDNEININKWNILNVRQSTGARLTGPKGKAPQQERQSVRNHTGDHTCIQ